MPGLRLQHRIVVPFVLIAIVATAAAAWVALAAASEALGARLRGQLVSAAGVVGRGDLALNPAIVRSVQQLLGADVVTFGAGGDVLATSLPPADPLVATIVRAGAADAVRGATEPVVVPVDCGRPCLAVYRQLEGRPDTTVAIVADTSALATATRTVARATLVAAALSILLMVFVSQAVVRRVTAPLDRLVRFVRELPPHGKGARAPAGGDEVGQLAIAFNDMLDRLERSQDALVRSEKLALAGLLAARVAHDIRNPLSAIKMQAQLLRTHLDDADAKSALEAVLRDVNQVESVIRDLLELSRPGELRREPASINTIVEQAMAQLSPQFTHRRIAVDLQLAPDLPPTLLDTGRLKQAVLNVLVNASEAMPTGGRIVVTSRPADGGVALEICDDGTGIDPSLVATVFDPFVSTKPDGVGLGLVNVKAVVEGHGGEIRLAPRQPRGVCVTIRIPGMATHG